MKIHRLQNSCQKGAAGAKEARRDRPWKEASGKLSACPAFSFPFCTSAQYPQGCHWPARRGIHKQLERPREKPAKLMTPAAARWLRAWHKGPPLQIWAAFCTSHEFFKLYDSRAVKLWRIKQVFQLSVLVSVLPLPCWRPQQRPKFSLFGWAGEQECQSISFLLPKKQKGHLLLLLLTASQHKVGGCCGR